tara:strand:+ start:106 stop:564 length:459 start_codon:yes stop_codon:yes gene_type:complete
MGDISSKVGKWLTVSADKSGNGVKHQCKASFANNDLNGAGDYAYTKSFDWPVMSDFSVYYETKDTNGDAQTLVLDGTDSDLNVTVQGSVDGINYVNMHDTNDIIREGAEVGVFVYDIDGSGIAPFIRLKITSDDGFVGTHDLYVSVIPHVSA